MASSDKSTGTQREALLLLDFQAGIGDQPWSRDAVSQAQTALQIARERKLTVVFSKVSFTPGYLDVSSASPAFSPYREGDMLPPEASRLVDGFAPQSGEGLVDKNRFSPFAGSRLASILRSQHITRIVLAGVSTSGVVLATFVHGENNDLTMTVLTDACADPDTNLHDTLIGHLFPRSAQMRTVAQWVNDGHR